MCIHKGEKVWESVRRVDGAVKEMLFVGESLVFAWVRVVSVGAAAVLIRVNSVCKGGGCACRSVHRRSRL